MHDGTQLQNDPFEFSSVTSRLINKGPKILLKPKNIVFLIAQLQLPNHF